MIWENNNFDINDFTGFIYRITELNTGKMYIGKKSFWSFTTKLKPGKKRRTHFKKESNWRTYTSSSKYVNEAIQANGIENYKFEIVSLHKTKSQLNYAEIELQVMEDVLRVKLDNGDFKFLNKQIGNLKFGKLI